MFPQKARAYRIISLVFFILAAIGFAYCFFFYPVNHPMYCLLREATGRACPTCGFSRAFSCYTHLLFSQGKTFNALSFLPFLFFMFQLVLRGGLVAWSYGAKKIISSRFIAAEIIISISLFLLAFLPVILSFKNYGHYL